MMGFDLRTQAEWFSKKCSRGSQNALAVAQMLLMKNFLHQTLNMTRPKRTKKWTAEDRPQSNARARELR